MGTAASFRLGSSGTGGWLRKVASIALASLALACSAAGSPPDVDRGCRAWLTRTVRACEAVAMSARYGCIVAALGDGCADVPAPIRAAAVRVARLPSRAAQAAPLAEAAAAVLGARCAIADPQAPALAIVKACPAGAADFPVARRALADIRAADWALLVALQRSFVEAGVYDASAERLLLTFALSSAILGEAEQRGE